MTSPQIIQTLWLARDELERHVRCHGGFQLSDTPVNQRVQEIIALIDEDIVRLMETPDD